MESKALLRRHLKKIRDGLDDQKMSTWSRLLSDDLRWVLRDHGFNGVLFLYAPVKGEPDLLSAARQYQCHLALPRIIGQGTMTFHLWTPGEALEPGAFGIMAPSAASPLIIPRDGDGIVVPALAIDASGSRLGFGGGYYDRYLERFRGAFSFVAGAVFPPLFSERALPSETHDHRVDFCLKITQTV
jgi:5-formyltetrahydrofolate cyclo-ligase